MAYVDFPQLSNYVTKVQDKGLYSIEHEDHTVRSEFEGGYEATRPGHHRNKLRRTFSTGWTDMTKAEREALETFYGQLGAGSVIWVWKNPWDDYVPSLAGSTAGDTFVRFTESLKFTSKVYGDTLLYDCQIILREM